jgi:hypothetical protein
MSTIENTWLCDWCKNLTDSTDFKCRAFPNGIPSDISLGLFTHTIPFADETILFEEAENSELVKPIPKGGYLQELIDNKHLEIIIDR